MKNKIAIASAFLAASSFSAAEIVINDFLSFEGFVDMSYVHTDQESAIPGLPGADGTDSSYQIDQVEISWLFDFEPVTAQIDVQYEGESNEYTTVAGDTVEVDQTIVEQAFATYSFGDGRAITAGRYASMIGFEAFEPTGLYQYSFAYDMEISDITIIPGYSQGVKYTVESENSFFGISLQDSAFDNDDDALGGGGSDSTFGLEVVGSYTMENGLSGFLGLAYEDGDADQTDGYMVNAYVTYETGAWLFAGEVNYGEFEAGSALVDLGAAAGEEEVFQALVMANYAYSDAASVTARASYSDHDVDNTDADQAEFTKLTLAHGYAFTDNLFLVNEISAVDADINVGGTAYTYEAFEAAVELIFSF